MEAQQVRRGQGRQATHSERIVEAPEGKGAEAEGRAEADDLAGRWKEAQGLDPVQAGHAGASQERLHERQVQDSDLGEEPAARGHRNHQGTEVKGKTLPSRKEEKNEEEKKIIIVL